MKYTDTELLNWLEEQNSRKRYTGECIFRWSSTGRGWRIHEAHKSRWKNVKQTVREAIADAIDAEKNDTFTSTE